MRRARRPGWLLRIGFFSPTVGWVDRRPILTRLAELAGIATVLVPLISLIVQADPSARVDPGTASETEGSAGRWLRHLHAGVHAWGDGQSTTVLINWAAAVALAVFLVSFLVLGTVGFLLDAGLNDTRYAAQMLGRLLIWIITVSALFLWVFWSLLPIWAVWAGVLAPLVVAFCGGRLGTAAMRRLARSQG